MNIADDICVYGNTKEEADIDHDRNLMQLLDKCSKCTIIESSSLGWLGSICIAKLDYARGIPRACACFYNDNGIADLVLIIGQQRMRLESRESGSDVTSFTIEIALLPLILWNY